ncbi:MAG: hypothetical protein J6S09_04180 [Paludibacteraceae bacterium]|nr:hypothetical protein [Paludibacteraceae bacterium]
MKKWVVFLLGLISGVVLTLVTMVILAMGANTNANNNGVTLFDQPGECLNAKAFEVMQVVDNNHALAHEVEWNDVLERYMQTGSGLLVLVTNDNGEYYYDDQIIEVPQGMCMRQVGIYRYQTRMDMEKTVPIVKLMSK